MSYAAWDGIDHAHGYADAVARRDLADAQAHGDAWADELFEFELCELCLRDREDHEVIPGPFMLPLVHCLREPKRVQLSVVR